MIRINNKLLLLTIIGLLFNCKEPFEIEVLDFDNVLVVEGTITNELKQHQINLSRTYELDQTEPIQELNATVWIEDNQNNIYTFTQNGDGKYISDISFQAIENVNYKLFITTQDGQQYTSSDEELTSENNISDVFAELAINIDGEEGIQIMVDSNNPSGSGNYYRYTYDETYKIVTPNFFNIDISFDNYLSDLLTGEVFYDITITPRIDGDVCYTTKPSIGILQTETAGLEENNISRFPVRFIKTNNSIIRDRYSIIVSQYVQSIEAHTFYRVINELGSVQSLLSQNQPGYVAGNVSLLNDTNNAKVLGFFEVSSVSSKRIYLDYSDFGLEKPPYFYECISTTLDYRDNTTADFDLNERSYLYNLVTVSNWVLEHTGLTGQPEDNPIYIVTNEECGNCTSFSSKIKPDFWVD